MISVLRGKKIFITGINGFVGSNLAYHLYKKGADVCGLVRSSKVKSLLHFEGLDKKLELVTGDLNDKHLTDSLISEKEFDYVFHLAAQVEVGVGLKNPQLTFESNIKGTYNLLESIRLYGQKIQAIVVASTDKAYGEYSPDQMPYKEDYPLLPRFPYDVSKACADLIAQSYASNVYKLPIVVTRFSNIYGPGQMNFSAIIPQAISCCLTGKDFEPRGDGEHIRDFLYIEDVTSLYEKIAIKLQQDPVKYRGEIYNAGTEVPHRMKEVLKEIYNHFDMMSAYDIVLQKMREKKTVGELNCQYMGFDKVKRDFGWTPETNFSNGLVKTIDWFKYYFSKESRFYEN